MSATAIRPEFVLAGLDSSYDGKTCEVIAVYNGERGYHPTTYGRQTKEWIEEQNARLGINPATAAAYSLCSVFGNWERYDKTISILQKTLEAADARTE